MIAKQRSALQVEFITGVKLIYIIASSIKLTFQTWPLAYIYAINEVYEKILFAVLESEFFKQRKITQG